MARIEKNEFLIHKHNNRILLPLITLLLMIGITLFVFCKQKVAVFKQKRSGATEF
jgi:hypothetical protein